MTKYCFVIDSDGNPLSPTKEIKGWYMIRKGKATLITKYPMTIQLKRAIPTTEICKDEVRCGIDDGSKHVGIALVQKCQTKNKVLFKGTVEQRNDVKHLLSTRKGYRKFRRQKKRYRPVRVNNKKTNKISPSILQKKQAIIRVIKRLKKWTIINTYWLEDVAINVRALTEGYTPYSWQYQKPNRLDENIRKSVIMRDNFKCMECGKTNVRLEVHHIRPRRLNGSNSINNLITLCEKCHQKTENNELQYMQHFLNILGKEELKGFDCASHVMVGKKWLREKLLELGQLNLTNGGDTANKRIDWNVDKSHTNDAVCITNLKPDLLDVQEWIIKPLRKKRKKIINNVDGFAHRDFIKYKPKSQKTSYGYITSLFPKRNKANFTDTYGKEHKGISLTSCKVLWKFSHIFWFDKMLESI